MHVMLAASGASSSLHLPWWIWAIAAAGLVATGIEEQQRTQRRARHRAYLRSPEWKARRRGALARAGGRCQDCGTTRDLHVHHLTYKRHGHEPARDLRVLCARCHRRRHSDGGRADDVADRLVGWLRDS